MVVVPHKKITSVVDNKYKAVVIVAKEVRRLNKVQRDKPDLLSRKPTIVAIKKFIEGNLQYKEE